VRPLITRARGQRAAGPPLLYPILTQVGAGGNWTKTTGVFVDITELAARVLPESIWRKPLPTTPAGKRRALADANWDGDDGVEVFDGGALLARFEQQAGRGDRRGWDEEKDGLIYGDTTWLRSLQQALREQGFSHAAADDIDYSEQGMQGGGQVDMDAGPNFLREWRDRFGPDSFEVY
jgi:hypothetical protein